MSRLSVIIFFTFLPQLGWPNDAPINLSGIWVGRSPITKKFFAEKFDRNGKGQHLSLNGDGTTTSKKFKWTSDGRFIVFILPPKLHVNGNRGGFSGNISRKVSIKCSFEQISERHMKLKLFSVSESTPGLKVGTTFDYYRSSEKDPHSAIHWYINKVAQP